MVPDEGNVTSAKSTRLQDVVRMVPDEGNVTSAESTRLQDVVRLANNLMDQKVRASAARQVENKRRWESNQGNNHVQQPLP
nr:hypothetical protein [Tanacetum cinerariifolium]